MGPLGGRGSPGQTRGASPSRENSAKRDVCKKFTSSQPTTAADTAQSSLIATYLGHEHAVVAAIAFAHRVVIRVRGTGLHPFVDGDPGFVLVDPRDTEVPKPRSASTIFMMWGFRCPRTIFCFKIFPRISGHPPKSPLKKP